VSQRLVDRPVVWWYNQNKNKVVTRGLLLYSRDEDFRVAYELYTRKRYFDFRPVLAMMREAYFACLEAGLREKALYG